MSDYFSHSCLSNSDIKDFLKKIGRSFEDPANLQEIFDLGILIENTILEPHQANKQHDQYELALAMRDTFWRDPVCRNFAISDDFQRQQPFFEPNVQVGQYKVNLRCKTDGVRTRLKVFLELKGLNLDNEKAFKAAIERYEYDQAAVHYCLAGGFNMGIIVGISKKDPTKLFKWIFKKHDDFYAIGEEKLIQDLTLLHDFSPEDVQMIAA